MTGCPNGCDLEEFGGTHQGPPDCDLEPSNPDHRGRFGVTDDEKLTIGASMVLLENATSNSLDPMVRRGWNEDRDIMLQRLRGMLR